VKDTRKYVVRQLDAEGEPIIMKGECGIHIDDRYLVPNGYQLIYVQSTPALKTVFVELNYN